VRRSDDGAPGTIIYDRETIAARVRELGVGIARAYPDGELIVLGVLKGSFIFLADLVREISRPVLVDFLIVSSYRDATMSSGSVDMLYDSQVDVRDRHVLLVEDIVDSGRTLDAAMSLLATREPRSLDACALLHKHAAEHTHWPVRFVGFDAPDVFLVGYGLDHAERYRHLPYITSLA
jgi:hypoxanthine phosphoribosyltransferase